MLLEDKVAIITGAGRGIGRAIAKQFAAEGAAVVLAARTQQEIDAAATEIQESGGKAKTVVADVARDTDCARIVAAAREAFGRTDVLVNNAGVLGPVKPVEGISADEWDAVLAANLRSAFLLARLVLPEMYERGSGVVLNISSVAAKMAFAWNAPYAASKAGMLALTRSLAAEAARKGVRVNALCPGIVSETKMSQELGAELGRRLGVDPAKELAMALESVLQGRATTADEVARAALFLVSGLAAGITGQSLNVDGGMAFL
jgi:NAD(P)-dependent dehydrogenase (short-subunit alcohol dehydrogenase family)